MTPPRLAPSAIARWSSLLAVLATLHGAALAAITPGSRAPTANDTVALELINRFRADPQGELPRLLGANWATLSAGVTLSTTPTANNGTPWSAGFWTNRAAPGNQAALAMDFFHVSPGDLLKQWLALPASGTLHPLTWNGNLGQSALGYADLVVADAGASGSPHAVPPYGTFGFQRYTDAGYTSALTVGENIAPAFPNDLGYIHAGFAVDWGSTADGIQSPPGHRDSMLSTSFSELGIGIANGYGGVGNVTEVQHFGQRSANVSQYVYGYAWQDLALGSYTPGEGIVGATVQLLNGANAVVASTATDANGGYTLQVAGLADGAYQVRFEIGGLPLGQTAVTIGNAALMPANLVSAVPEPQTWALLAAGGLLVLRRARRVRPMRSMAA